MPYDRTSGPASGWLETTAGISICSDSGAGAEEQVVEAVQVLGDHDQRPVRRRRVPELERPCRTPAATVAKSAPQRRPRRPAPATLKSIRMKNRSGQPVAELLALQDVAAVLDQEAGLTACTIPGRSGQERIRTKSPDGAVAVAVRASCA